MAIWANRIIVKRVIGRSPFELVYGTQVRIPLENILPVYKFVLWEDLNMPEPMEERLEHLAELDETRRLAQRQNVKLQSQVKYLFDKKAKDRKFEIDDLVLMWNSRCQEKGKHGKFESLWLGPFVIFGKGGDDSYHLQNMSGEEQELPVHGKYLKPLFL